MRVDELARRLAAEPPFGAFARVSPISARELFLSQDDRFRATGSEIRRRFGVLLHYTSYAGVELIRATGTLGLGEHGVFLTPSLYAGCMVPANLGLRRATDRVLVVDPASLPELWGPGTAVPSDWDPLWVGGGVEFFSPAPIRLEEVLQWEELGSCGDGHE